MSDIDTLARTIFGEQRGGGKLGMQSVANVVLNRVAMAQNYVDNHAHRHPLFGDGTISLCCKMPYQFSCWNKNDVNLEIITKVDDSNPVFADAIQVASDVINGVLGDITDGATHYYSMKLSNSPGWAIGKDPCQVIAGQYFFNNIS